MNNKKKVYYFIQAFISVWGIESLVNIGAQNIIGFVILAALYLFYRMEADYSKNVHSKLSLIIAGIFGILYTFYNCSMIKSQYDNKLFQLIVLFVVFMGIFFLIYHAINAVFTWYRTGKAYGFMYTDSYANRKGDSVFFANIDKLDVNLECEFKELSGIEFINKADNKIVKRLLFGIKKVISRRVFLCSFIICLIFWLPGYLYEYPGIITPDSINQIEQTLGLVPLSNHHPIAHTLLIGLCLRPVYAVTGNINTAIGFYTLVQMILMALIVAYSINTLRLIELRLRWVYLALLFYTIIPFQWVYMVTMWKDVLFAGFVMLFAASFIRLVVSNSPGCDLIIHFIACVGTALYRNNGLYAFFLMIPFMCIWGLKALKKRKSMLNSLSVLKGI